MNILTILIVDDHIIFRNGLSLMLNKMPNVKVIGEASDGVEFLELMEKNPAELVFMDIKMPVMNGIEATRKSKEKYPDTNIIALTMFGDEKYINSMIEAGASGFLLKNTNISEIEKAVNKVAGGEDYFSEEVIKILTNHNFTHETAQDENMLSARELEILNLICKGYSNTEIGRLLFISPRTVDGHRANLLNKTNSRNTVSLVMYAIKNKLISL